MRIIAGSARGLRLSAPPGLGTRPVLDRVKESWFACLGDRVAGAAVLDLYAGVGSLGLEALSRGARSCVFVESDPGCVRLLRGHLEKARLADRSDVQRMEVSLALDALSRSGVRFDLVFLDPPFELAREAAFSAEGGALARAAGLLAPGGLAMLRCESGGRGRRSAPQRSALTGGRGPAEPGEAAPSGTTLSDRRRWGRSEVLFYVRHDRA